MSSITCILAYILHILNLYNLCQIFQFETTKILEFLGLFSFQLQSSRHYMPEYFLSRKQCKATCF